MSREKPRSKAAVILVIFISFIMVSSVIGFLVGNQPSGTASFKGKKFTREQLGWTTKIDGRKFYFDFTPQQVLNISFNSKIIPALKGKLEIDVTSDPSARFSDAIGLAQYNLGFNLNNLGIYVRQGFTGNNSFELPIIRCEDSSPNVPVLYFRDGNRTSRQELNSTCIMLEFSTEQEIHAVKDRLLYGILGIIP
ncbi:hypothetical protein HYU14_05720 [Candidatus Woesearchaeota archaeon]|nr:hypothetical protein [Candidatus Woesearchaeota archaeon]